VDDVIHIGEVAVAAGADIQEGAWRDAGGDPVDVEGQGIAGFREVVGN
jgi:hypothetical protein